MTPQGDNVFDYVVVGSGAGGGPLAANLARDGFRVLLLEAGPGAAQSQDYLYSVPVFHALACEAPEMCWEFFVKHYGDEARQAEDSKVTPRGVLYPRAGTLGGCTAHNAMITILPHPSDWDYIASVTGDDSWLASNMQGYFEKLERCTYVPRPKDGENPTGHGFDGWLSTSVADAKMAVTDPALLKVVLSAAETAIAEHVGHALPSLRTHFDPNDARVAMHSPEGLAVTPLATRDGHRNGTREFILETQRQFPDNLVVRTNCLVTRVLFDAERRATGVEYLEGARLYRADPNASRQASDATRRTVQVSREVILSGGAFNSPQLLKLSGVGPRAELERFGIPVVLDLPGVGENLQDRYEVGVVSEMRFDFRLLAGGSFRPPETGENPDTLFSDWLQGKGPYTTNGAVIAVVKRSKPERPVPDLIIFGLPGFFRGYYPGFSQQVERDKHHFTWAILKAHTNNHAGTVRLRSADPLDTPEINFHYFDEGSDASGEDLESVIEGVEFVRRMNKRLGLLVRKEALPGEGIQTRDQLREFIRREAWGHHASCSNKMGPASDPAAVVDSAFRVHGTKGLRVVDASVFPRIPGFFIVSAIYMISEKAAAVIAADARRESAAAG